MQSNPIQNSVDFFVDIIKLILKFIWRSKGRRQNRQNNFAEDKVGDYNNLISSLTRKPQ